MEFLIILVAIVFGLFFLKVILGILGVAMHLVILPFKILFGVLLFALALPFLLLLLPFVLLAGVAVFVGGLMLGVLCLLALAP